jgi:hypothetical protein
MKIPAVQPMVYITALVLFVGLSAILVTSPRNGYSKEIPLVNPAGSTFFGRKVKVGLLTCVFRARF